MGICLILHHFCSFAIVVRAGIRLIAKYARSYIQYWFTLSKALNAITNKLLIRFIGYYRIWQNIQGGKLLQFLQFFTQLQIFPMNDGLVNWQYKSTHKHATAKASQWITIFHSKRESFPPWMFCCIWYSSRCDSLSAYVFNHFHFIIVLWLTCLQKIMYVVLSNVNAFLKFAHQQVPMTNLSFLP